MAEEEFGNPEDLTSEEFAPDQTGQVIRWRDQVSSKKRAYHNKYGQSSVEAILKTRPAQDIIELLNIVKEDEQPKENETPPVEVTSAVAAAEPEPAPPVVAMPTVEPGIGSVYIDAPLPARGTIIRLGASAIVE